MARSRGCERGGEPGFHCNPHRSLDGKRSPHFIKRRFRAHPSRLARFAKIAFGIAGRISLILRLFSTSAPAIRGIT